MRSAVSSRAPPTSPVRSTSSSRRTGLIAVDRAFTAGYDFLSDAAVEIDANLEDVSTSTTSLISDIGTIPDWTIADLTGALRRR